MEDVLRLANTILNTLQLILLVCLISWAVFVKKHLMEVAKLLSQIESHLRGSIGNAIEMERRLSELRKKDPR